MRAFNAPVVSFASMASQLPPQITLIAFQPAPRKIPSYSCMILPLPFTGPSKRCKLQLITKIRLSSFSRAANAIAPCDSGSVISPSPQKHHTLRPAVLVKPRESKYFRKRAW